MFRLVKSVLAVLAVVLTAVAVPTSASATDWSGDGKADILVINNAGQLQRYNGNGVGWTTGSADTIGCCTWQSYSAVVEAADFSGDGKPDLLARKSNGSLVMYRGNGVGGWVTGAEEQIGCCDWNDATALVAPGDFSGDGRPDILVKNRNGSLQMYRGNGAGGWITGVGEEIGCCSWNDATTIFSPGDFSGDGKPDVLAVMSDGRLLMYRGNGAGGWIAGAGEQIGCCAWNQVRSIMSPGDFDGDGHPDVLTVEGIGVLHLYRGNGAGGWVSTDSMSIGCCGWNDLYGMVSFTQRNAGVPPLNGLLGIAQDTEYTVFPLFSHPSYLPLVNAKSRFRLIADWDAKSNPAKSGELGRVASLIDNAPAGTEILVTLRNRKTPLPSAAAYRSGVQQLEERFRRVNYWGVLNEPNLVGASGSQVSGYYAELVGLVGAQKVVGPDVLDPLPAPSGSYRDISTSNPVDSSVAAWVQAYRNAGGGFGRAAAFHPYGGISRRSAAALDAYLNALPSNTPVWLTESGALRGGTKSDGNPYTVRVDGAVVDDAAQNLQVRFLLDSLLGRTVGTRTTERAYYYALRDDPNFSTGLLDPFTNKRPAWKTFCLFACQR